MPTIDVGGVEKNFILISNFLAQNLGKVTIVTTSYNLKNVFRNNIKFASYKNISNRLIPRRIKFFIALIILFIELLKNKNNLVFSFQANFYCILLCKLMRTKVIIRSNTSPTGWSDNVLKKKLYKYTLYLADIVLANSIKFKNILNDEFGIKAICIYNPLNIQEIIKKSKKKIKIPFFSNTSINFINVARLEDQKDQFTLINAFKKINSIIKFKLLIIGEGKNKRKLNDLINKYKLNNSIKIVSFKKNPYPYIKRSDVFILSSIFEGLPNVLLEALALNKFIISSDCPTGPSEILDNGKGGLLFKMKNSDDLKKKILFFFRNKKICLKKIKYAKRRLGRFDYNTNMNKYLKLVNSISF